MPKSKILNLLAMLFCGLIVIAVISLFIGQVVIPISKMFIDRYVDIFKLRLFRVVLAVSAGAGLSLAGLILQNVLRNPLAEPYVLGVSSGSALGASIGLIFFSAWGNVGLLAFLGGVLTIVTVYKLSKIDNKTSTENMIIAGILVNALCSSLLMFFISNSQSTKTHTVIWWLLGNLQVFSWFQVLIVSALVLMGYFLAFIFSRELNAISLGEEEALHLGVDVEKVKIILLLVSSLLTSIIVSVCGIIGFVGLMVPHAARRLFGPDNRILVPASFLIGGIFLLLCDTVSRVCMAPKEIPIGVITAFIGCPFFGYILRKHRKIYYK